VELLLTLTLLGACFATGGVLLTRGLATSQARGAAQAWQAAATWAQVGALWHGTGNEVLFESGRIEVASDLGIAGGDLGSAAPPVPAVPNVARWKQAEGVVVSFVGGSAAPNSAGSIYFRAPGGDYRVTVRLESGLTVRSRVEAGQ
jgi:hypothetical protein